MWRQSKYIIISQPHNYYNINSLCDGDIANDADIFCCEYYDNDEVYQIHKCRIWLRCTVKPLI